MSGGRCDTRGSQDERGRRQGDTGSEPDRLRVLLVSHEPAILERAGEALEREDVRFQVDTETTVDAALDRVEADPIDCVVCGHDAPGTDGLAFLTRVRDRDPHLPFVLLPERGSEELAAEAIGAGVTAYVPSSGDEDRFARLADRVAESVDRHGSGRPREEHQLFRQLLDHSTDEIYVIDPPTGRLVDANETACSRLGYSHEDLLTRSVADIAAGIEAEDWPDHAETVREEGGVVFLANHVRSDGSTYPVEVNVVHVEDAEVEYMVAINRNMAERKAQERELLRYRAIVESMDEALFVLAPDGTYEYANEAAVTNTPFSREELLGTHFVEVLDSGLLAVEDRRDEYVELVEGILDGRRTSAMASMEIETPAGERRIVETELTEITSSQEGRLGVVGVTRDVTERIEYQLELERQNERLDEFASVLSHDLRNPLNVAEGRVQLARDECGSEHLAEAADAHGRMRTLIDDLLSMARSGGSIDRTEPVSLREAAEKCWAVVETGEAELRVDDDVSVLAHPSRLEQLLENLLRNSVEHGSNDRQTRSDDSVEHGSTGSRAELNDAAEPSGRSATIAVGGLDGGFYVEDDGPGIPDDEREQVFEPGHTTSEGGSGLGLAIVEQIAAAHGWSVRATDAPGGGARFEFTGVESPGA